MKIKMLSLCLMAALSAILPAATLADTQTNPQDMSVAPVIPQSTLRQLPWQTLMPPVKQEIILDGASPRIQAGDITGPVAAVTLPANRGSLSVTLSSLAKGQSVFAPNVLVLDEQMHPAAFFPSSYFPYEKPGGMSMDRLEGTLKLTPALGQKQIYLLIYTTRQDLLATTTMSNPAKAYAEGVGNAVPDIPDPIGRHSETGALRLNVAAEQKSGNITIGQIFSGPETQPVVVGNAAPVASQAPAAVAPAAPMLTDTERYFNQAIKQAVREGNIDKALKLLNEAERLGSSSARQTFISSVKGKG
ncbi:maltose operon protein MalM [Acerihabitans arboris]|uniref:Maltose operon protein MalM n=1 Tax=Acerihabitans arboris TaxID=2691583 RepID=A0A845SKB0_9GAMM|nr:maltose operon protein MalM [Acerihabitans arboris]NDL63822.1 maltose operon protein MalM [Acerihabitans arboris]